jgi:hypothetical protein
MRVNVETRGMAKAKRLAAILGIHHESAIGMLCFLWRDSQDNEVIESNAQEISLWFDPYQRLEPDKIIAALIECEFILKTQNENIFEISGNKKHSEKISDLRNKGSNGGKKSGVTRRNKKQTQSKQMVQPESKQMVEANTMQFNTIQNNTIQKQYTIKKPNLNNNTQEFKNRLLVDLKSQSTSGGFQAVSDEEWSRTKELGMAFYEGEFHAPQDIVRLWNKYAEMYAETKDWLDPVDDRVLLNANIVRNVVKALEQHKQRHFWRIFFSFKIGWSEFLKGQAENSQFKATFEWVFNPTNFEKINELKYINNSDERFEIEKRMRERGLL